MVIMTESVPSPEAGLRNSQPVVAAVCPARKQRPTSPKHPDHEVPESPPQGRQIELSRKFDAERPPGRLRFLYRFSENPARRGKAGISIFPAGFKAGAMTSHRIFVIPKRNALESYEDGLQSTAGRMSDVRLPVLNLSIRSVDRDTSRRFEL